MQVVFTILRKGNVHVAIIGDCKKETREERQISILKIWTCVVQPIGRFRVQFNGCGLGLKIMYLTWKLVPEINMVYFAHSFQQFGLGSYTILKCSIKPCAGIPPRCPICQCKPIVQALGHGPLHNIELYIGWCSWKFHRPVPSSCALLLESCEIVQELSRISLKRITSWIVPCHNARVT